MSHNTSAETSTGRTDVQGERTSAGEYISVASLMDGLAVAPEDDPTVRWLFDG